MNGRYGAGDVFAVFQHFDAVSRVTGRIGCTEDRLDSVVLDQFLEGGIGLVATAFPGQVGAAIGGTGR